MNSPDSTDVTLPNNVVFSLAEVCSTLGISRSKLYVLVKTGALPARKLGTRTIVLRADLIGFLSRLPEARAA